MTFARMALATGVLLSIPAITSCGGGSSYGSPSGSTPAPARPSAVAANSPASGGTQKQLTITAKDFSFSADTVNVAKGDAIAIAFKNSGSASHTLAFYSDAAYQSPIAGADTGSVAGGATKALTVTVGDGLYYRCNIHPTLMHGEIQISSAQAPSGTPTADARGAPVDAPTASGAAMDAQPPASTNSTVPTQATEPAQAPSVAPTPIPPIAPSPTHAAPTATVKPYVPPPYNY